MLVLLHSITWFVRLTNLTDIRFKVIPKLGLCVSVYDIRSITGGLIFPGDGAPTYTVFNSCKSLVYPYDLLRSLTQV